MVEREEIMRWLDGEAPSALTVDSLSAEFPWWLLPAAMRLRNAKDLTDDERSALATRLATGAPDIEQMSLAANSDLEADLSRFYPIEQPSTPDTEGTIEKFLNTYGHADKAEEELLNRLIFNPTPDYAQLLAQEEEANMPEADEAPEGSNDALINSFIIKSKNAGGAFPPAAEEATEREPSKPQAPVQEPPPEADSTLSESLALVYIKRKKYQKAFEIISHLNLNFPEKSIYFADQLRFLSKLIAIEERKSAYIDKKQ